MTFSAFSSPDQFSVQAQTAVRMSVSERANVELSYVEIPANSVVAARRRSRRLLSGVSFSIVISIPSTDVSDGTAFRDAATSLNSLATSSTALRTTPSTGASRPTSPQFRSDSRNHMPDEITSSVLVRFFKFAGGGLLNGLSAISNFVVLVR